MKSELFNQKPRVPENLVYKEKDDRVLVVNPDIPKWIVVSKSGAEIIKLCDGKRTVLDILAFLKLEKQSSDEPTIIAFLSEILSSRIFEKSDDTVAKIINARMTSTHVYNAQLNVTNACNLQCRHCYRDAGKAILNELTLKEVLNLATQLKKLGVHEITITGGEPLMRADLVQIIRFARTKDIEVALLTNGTLIDDKLSKCLGEQKVKVGVSLDGANSRSHDFIRGKGTFDRTIKGIQRLVENGERVSINSTLTKVNLEEIEEMFELCTELGVSSIRFVWVQIVGRASRNASSLALTVDEIIEASRLIHVLGKEWQAKLQVGTDLETESKAHFRVAHSGCGGGSSQISIASDGDVFPCDSLHFPEFKAGNIRQASLKDILKSTVFDTLKCFDLTKIQECRACFLRFSCGGGCHLHKITNGQELYSVHPLCKAFRTLTEERIWELSQD